MPRPCSLCTHPDRLAIETALRSALPLRTIADRWAVSKTALIRHRQRHGAPQAPEEDPHPVAVCAATVLLYCLPEVRARYEAAAARLGEPLDRAVVTGLHGYVRHLDQCRPW